MTFEPTIGIDTSRSYRALATGTERYSRRLIEHLLARRTPGISYRLYFNDAPPADAPLQHAEIRSLPARRFWTHYRLSRELRSNPVDLLFVPSHVLPVYHPVRSVVTIHDLGYLYEPDSYSVNALMQLKLTTRWNARQATRLIAISESTKRDLIEHCHVHESKIAVIPHGTDDRFCVLPRDEVERYRRAARLPEKFVLYLGTVQPRKNLERLIGAFELAASRDRDLKLVIAGKIGWLSDPIIGRVHDSPYSSRIRLLGHVPDPQLPSLYNAATVFALPSLYEGFGLPTLEAMACGVPAVISNRGALPELAGADAVIVDPLDTAAIAEGITLAVTARDDQALVRSRIEHARRFSWERSAEQTEEALLHALREPLDAGE